MFEKHWWKKKIDFEELEFDFVLISSLFPYLHFSDFHRKKKGSVLCIPKVGREEDCSFLSPQVDHLNLMLHQNHLENLLNNADSVDLGWTRICMSSRPPCGADVALGVPLPSKNTLVFPSGDPVDGYKGKESKITHHTWWKPIWA